MGRSTVNGASILIVDDSAEMRNFLVNMVFGPEGYAVHVARDGLEALDAINSHEPNLIISDIAMPNMDGLELAEVLRQEGKAIPVILMTAEGSESVAVRALRAQVRDYFVKPFDPLELMEAAERILAEAPASPARSSSDAALDALTLMQTPFLLLEQSGSIRASNAAARKLLNIDANQTRLDSFAEGRDLLQMLDWPLYDGMAQGEIQLGDQHSLLAQISLVPGERLAIVLIDINTLRQLEMMKSEMVASISHDMRSPLTAVLSYLELMRRTNQLTPSQEAFNEQVSAGVRTLASLLDELMKIDTLELHAAYQRENSSLDEIIRQAIQMQQATADLKKVVLDIKSSDGLPPVEGNPLRLRQAFLNLLDNAVKYTPEGGKVQISISEQDEQLIASITDTGMGIPLEDQPHVFEKFFRAKGVEKISGTGRGLNIVRSIIEAHGGRIWLDSKPGQGTTFTVVLPAAKID